jgi:hypothetical protein
MLVPVKFDNGRWLPCTQKSVYTEPHWDQLLCSEEVHVEFIQVKFTKFSFILTLSQVRWKFQFIKVLV